MFSQYYGGSCVTSLNGVRDGTWETSWKAPSLIKVRDGSSEKWSHSAYMLKVKVTDKIWGMRERGIRDKFKILA